MTKQKTGKRVIILYILTAFWLGGCADEESLTEEVRTIEAEDIPIEISEMAKGQEKNSTDRNASQDTETARLRKYQTVLTDVIEKQIYPDGTDCSFVGSSPLSDNKFAVFDVDKDGKEELILCITTTYMSSMCEVIYDYNEKTDAVREEFVGFPDTTFYENGLVEEMFSHNQGMAFLGDFWPYFLHRYQAEADSYQCIFTVDAWEKECRAEDYDGNPYPEEIDVEKSGIVYFLMESGEYNIGSKVPVSKSVYEKWRTEQGLGSERIEIPFQGLTEENIKNILE